MLGCGKDSPLGSSSGNSNSQFSITVEVNGTKATYSWSAGKAFSVTVVRTSDPTTIVWGVATPGQDNIASPVTHGDVPTGALETATTEGELTKGVEYRVSVAVIDGNKVGFKDFTP
ncbi:MAG: hypothetical protein ACE5HO_16255 [bacterium]